MIGSLRGRVAGIVRETAVIETSGVGYGVFVPASCLARISEGDELFLWTHLAVRETAHDLYGFETKEELMWFELLLSVSGIGPKSALSILNAADTRALEGAVAAQDASGLSKNFGIGKKTAEKIVLELREKVRASGPKRESGGDDVTDALIALGYTAREAREAAQAVSPEHAETEARIREAIRIAAKNI